VLDALYEAVGLRTIVIDRDSTVKTDSDRRELLEEFMLTLSLRAGPAGRIPGSERKMYVSLGLLDRIQTAVEELSAQQGAALGRPSMRLFSVGLDRVVPSPHLLAMIEQFAARQVSDNHLSAAQDTLRLIARQVNLTTSVKVLVDLVRAFAEHGDSDALTFLVAEGLLTFSTRQALLSADIPWSTIWRGRLASAEVEPVLKRIEVEVRGHESGTYSDEDVAYGVDLAHRIAGGHLTIEPDTGIDEARNLIERVADMYPAAATYEPSPDSPPDVDDICTEIAQRGGDEDEGDEDDGHEDDGAIVWHTRD
jgi:hypothetical protein